MAGVRVGVTVTVTDADQVVGGAVKRAANLAPVFRGAIDKSVSAYFRRLFDTEGAEAGKRWAPHRPLTVKLRRRPGHGRGGIGRDTNELWGSLVKVGPRSVRVIGRTKYERGTTVRYAEAFHTGVSPRKQRVFGRRPRLPLGIPARTLVPDPMPAKWVDEWEKAVADYIIHGTAR